MKKVKLTGLVILLSRYSFFKKSDHVKHSIPLKHFKKGLCFHV